jgi:hypothetical protein
VSIHGLKDTIGDTGCPEKTDFCEDLLTNERGSPNIYYYNSLQFSLSVEQIPRTGEASVL